MSRSSIVHISRPFPTMLTTKKNAHCHNITTSSSPRKNEHHECGRPIGYSLANDVGVTSYFSLPVRRVIVFIFILHGSL